MKKILLSKFVLFAGSIFVCILCCVVLLPLFSLILFSILKTHIWKKIDPTIPIAISFIWAPILGAILGIAMGIWVAIKGLAGKK